MVNPQLIGKVDPASREVREREARAEKEEERQRRFRNKRKKNTRKLKDHLAKDIFKDQVRREHVVADRRARKQFYQAEKMKTEREEQVLAENMGEVVRQSRDFVRSLK